MTVDRLTLAIVGVLIMASNGAYFMTQNEILLYVAPFVGFMLFQAAFTRFCPLPKILLMLGVRPGTTFN